MLLSRWCSNELRRFATGNFSSRQFLRPAVAARTATLKSGVTRVASCGVTLGMQFAVTFFALFDAADFAAIWIEDVGRLAVVFWNRVRRQGDQLILRLDALGASTVAADGFRSSQSWQNQK